MNFVADSGVYFDIWQNSAICQPRERYSSRRIFRRSARVFCGYASSRLRRPVLRRRDSNRKAVAPMPAPTPRAADRGRRPSSATIERTAAYSSDSRRAAFGLRTSLGDWSKVQVYREAGGLESATSFHLRVAKGAGRPEAARSTG